MHTHHQRNVTAGGPRCPALVHGAGLGYAFSLLSLPSHLCLWIAGLSQRVSAQVYCEQVGHEWLARTFPSGGPFVIRCLFHTEILNSYVTNSVVFSSSAFQLINHLGSSPLFQMLFTIFSKMVLVFLFYFFHTVTLTLSEFVLYGMSLDVIFSKAVNEDNSVYQMYHPFPQGTKIKCHLYNKLGSNIYIFFYLLLYSLLYSLPIRNLSMSCLTFLKVGHMY